MILWIKEKLSDLLFFGEMVLTIISALMLVGIVIAFIYAIILGVPVAIFIWLCDSLAKMF